MNRPMIVAGLLFILAVGLTIALGPGNPDDAGSSASSTAAREVDELTAVLYHNPNCGCCGEYVAYLREHGVDVEVQTTDGSEMMEIKDRFGIEPAMQSCHTMEIGGYAVEGHVPLAAIEQLLSEQPDVQGIALPGMPTGSPGMGGPKTEPFEVYEITDDGAELYLTL